MFIFIYSPFFYKNRNDVTPINIDVSYERLLHLYLLLRFYCMYIDETMSFPFIFLSLSLSLLMCFLSINIRFSPIRFFPFNICLLCYSICIILHLLRYSTLSAFFAFLLCFSLSLYRLFALPLSIYLPLNYFVGHSSQMYFPHIVSLSLSLFPYAHLPW